MPREITADEVQAWLRLDDTDVAAGFFDARDFVGIKVNASGNSEELPSVLDVRTE